MYWFKMHPQHRDFKFSFIDSVTGSYIISRTINDISQQDYLLWIIFHHFQEFKQNFMSMVPVVQYCFPFILTEWSQFKGSILFNYCKQHHFCCFLCYYWMSLYSFMCVCVFEPITINKIKISTNLKGDIF